MILIFEGARIWCSLDLPIHAAPVCLATEDIGPVLVRKGTVKGLGWVQLWELEAFRSVYERERNRVRQL